MRASVEAADANGEALPSAARAHAGTLGRVLVDEWEAAPDVEESEGAAAAAANGGGGELALLLAENAQIGASEPMRLLLAELLDAAFAAVHRALPALYDGRGALPVAKLVPKLIWLMPRVLDERAASNEALAALSADARLADLCWLVFSSDPPSQ